MTQKEKQLLLTDLCARLPYGVKVQVTQVPIGLSKGETLTYNRMYSLDESDEYITIKPYLRTMSSMTEEEYKELKLLSPYYGFAPYKFIGDWCPNYEMVDWLNAHHFDYRGLIEKCLAIEVTKENNPYET